MTKFKTEQEQFWATEFGDDYISRNCDPRLLASNIALFSKILEKTSGITSVIEFGANIGMNILAMKQLLPFATFSGVEINEKAAQELAKIPDVKAFHQSVLDFIPDYMRDFVFTKGILIHINPNELNAMYEKLYATARRYVCIAEYYNPSPVGIPYRGHQNRLFKRDFAGEMLDAYADLKLIDYGFIYHRDNNFRQDDINWFLLSK